MSALTSFRDSKKMFPASVSSLALGANVHAFAGGIACTNTNTGYGVTGTATTGLVARGIFAADVDNSGGGAAGALTAPVDVGSFWLDNDTTGSPCARANIDALCYILDDHTVTMNASGTSIAGIIRDVGTLGVLVQLGSPFASTLASEAGTRAALSTAIAPSSIAVPSGIAALVGIDGRQVAATTATGVAKVVIELKIDVVDGAGASNTDLLLDANYGKIEIHSAKFIKSGANGGASDTVRLANGQTTNYITASFALSGVAADTIMTAATIAQAYNTVNAGAYLRSVNAQGTTSVAGTWWITGVRV